MICPVCLGWMRKHDQLAQAWMKCNSCGFTQRNEKMAISLQELNPHGYETTDEEDTNLSILLEKMNKVRNAYAVPMVVTSGLRSQADQSRINPSAPKSKHLIGAACDIRDTDGSLAKWVQDNMALMEEIGLWFEDFGHTKGWVHFQILPPASGKRIFIP